MEKTIATRSRVSSALKAYLLAWTVWIVLSAFYVRFYLVVAVLYGRRSQGYLLAAAFVLQALLAPLFTLLKRFATLAEAVLLSIATAVLIEPLVLTTVLLHSKLFPRFLSFWDIDRLQTGYVSTILIVGGVVGGTVFGILRWRMLQWHPRSITDPPDDSWWNVISDLHYCGSQR